ncbi:MAG TPA: adenine phosphoribosyltransferase [Propionibacteriaceae bacterium]|nr:adenine phosphoribosyltransferase [Propionibacteriaceae bacterium]HPZ49172.1 adenine phosphoribosyltransferase [Propionibacteriaceae bacterium]
MAPTTQAERVALVASLIRDVPDYPKPGIVYKDITPLLGNHAAYQASIDALVDAAPEGIDVVVGMEARGFFFAGPVALALGAGFVPVRKPGKLPRDVFSESFALEYGSDTLTVHQDAIPQHARVMVIDDVLATGGTVGATAKLMGQLGADLVHVSVVMELGFLDGRAKLAAMGIENVSALITV